MKQHRIKVLALWRQRDIEHIGAILHDGTPVGLMPARDFDSLRSDVLHRHWYDGVRLGESYITQNYSVELLKQDGLEVVGIDGISKSGMLKVPSELTRLIKIPAQVPNLNLPQKRSFNKKQAMKLKPGTWIEVDWSKHPTIKWQPRQPNSALLLLERFTGASKGSLRGGPETLVCYDPKNRGVKYSHVHYRQVVANLGMATIPDSFDGDDGDDGWDD